MSESPITLELLDSLYAAGLWGELPASEWPGVRDSIDLDQDVWFGWPGIVAPDFYSDDKSVLGYGVDDVWIEPFNAILAVHGYRFEYDWNVEPQHSPEMKREHGLRIWIGGKPVSYTEGPRMFRPLTLMNSLLDDTDVGVRAWVVSDMYYNEEAYGIVWVLPVEIGELLSSDRYLSAYKLQAPVAVTGPPDTWEIR